jgi:hypothetical protein
MAEPQRMTTGRWNIQDLDEPATPGVVATTASRGKAERLWALCLGRVRR